jgi:phage terminase small subunit
MKRGVNPERLTDNQRKFVHEYCIDQNAKRAAQAAGYKVPDVAGAKLLRHRLVSQAIGALQAKDLAKLELTREEALRQLYYLATRDAHDFVDAQGEVLPIPQMNERARACIDGIDQQVFVNPETGERTIKTKLRLSPKAQGVEMAMKHKGLFAPDKVQVQAAVTMDWDRLFEDRRSSPDVIEGKLLPAEGE